MERCNLDLLLFNGQGFTFTLLQNWYIVWRQRTHKCARRVVRECRMERVKKTSIYLPEDGMVVLPSVDYSTIGCWS